MTTPGSARRAQRIDEIKQRKGLGRKPSADERDQSFPLSAAMKRRAAYPPSRTWPLTTGVLDQGSTSQCVAYSWTQFLFAAPISHKIGAFGQDIRQFTTRLYDWAQRNDEWSGENYDGTSVRAGAKGLVEFGYIERIGVGNVTGHDTAGYRWARNADEARDFVRGVGPVVFGIDWHDEMFAVDSKGFIKPEGSLAGGHAILVIGFSATRDAFRLVNSWGRGWGQNGRCWLSRKHANLLIADRNGEACSAVEIRRPAA